MQRNFLLLLDVGKGGKGRQLQYECQSFVNSNTGEDKIIRRTTGA